MSWYSGHRKLLCAFFTFQDFRQFCDLSESKYKQLDPMCGWWSVLYLQKMHKYCLAKATCTSVLRCSGCAACKRRFERGPEGFPGGTGPALAEQVAPIYPQRDASRLKKGPNNRGKNCKYHITSHDPTTKNSPIKKPLFFLNQNHVQSKKWPFSQGCLAFIQSGDPCFFRPSGPRPSLLAGANERASPPLDPNKMWRKSGIRDQFPKWFPNDKRWIPMMYFFSPEKSFFYDIG